MKIRLLVFCAALLCLLGPTTQRAYAYLETNDPYAVTKSNIYGCLGCHGTSTVDNAANGEGRQGPHGGYITTTNKCQTCHEIHTATNALLLPGLTITATCDTCHDGTGGNGVYGTLAARGYTGTVYGHSVDTTSLVPGGEPTTGGDAFYDFNGSLPGTGMLDCASCHSPHGTYVIADFTGDRRRNATDTAGYTSNRLLLQRPVSADVTSTAYGSSWCGACHKGRLNGVQIHNHPVDYGNGAFTYNALQVVSGVGASTTTTGTLGQSNFGYVMPYPRTAGQQGHVPICQQCHEDARHVGDVTQGTIETSETFRVTSADGTDSTDNPRFQTFPHESVNRGMLIETGDDLCTNCHDPQQQLP